MREIQASEAKTHLLQFLNEVEQGETFVITRHGKPIARLSPENVRDQAAIDAAIAGIRELRRTAGRLSLEEILSARDEGRK
jgi:prevent-host-death family protein